MPAAPLPAGRPPRSPTAPLRAQPCSRRPPAAPARPSRRSGAPTPSGTGATSPASPPPYATSPAWKLDPGHFDHQPIVGGDDAGGQLRGEVGVRQVVGQVREERVACADLLRNRD